MRFQRNSLEPESSQHRSARRRTRGTGLHRWAAVVGVAVALVLSLVGVAVASVLGGSGTATRAAGPHSGGLAAAAAHRSAAGRSGRSGARAASPATGAPSRTRSTAGVRARALRTSCRSVAHVGDSTSVDLISSAYLPDPAQQLGARYADVGVKHFLVDASGGRSIVEAMPGQVNGYNVASGWWAQGYRGCWVFALGTNDTANVSVGSAVGLMARVDRMMSAAHGEPVMWVNTRTLLSGGPWAEANQQAWDNTLRQALARYPNMRIFNWAAVAQPGWFLSDGIHYNSVGCAARARAIANALARAFPRHGHSHGQIVR